MTIDKELVTELHELAMKFADQALLLKIEGEHEKAEMEYSKAYDHDQRAADMIADQFDLEPTRSVLHRSAASLAVDCGKYREAERLISVALSGNPPDEIAYELRDLLTQVNFSWHLSLRGFKLEPDEFQFSMTGDAVGYGITSSDEFIDRLKNTETLVYRTAERKLKRPFRESGRIKESLKKEIELYVKVPKAASFAVSFKIGRHEQLSLPGMNIGEEVVNELMTCLEFFNKSEEKALKEKIPEAPYYRSFIGCVRNLAPDGKNIKMVGFTFLREGRERSVILTKAKHEILALPELKEIEKIEERVQVKGILRYADSRKEKEGEIRLIDDQGKSRLVIVPEGMMADIVRPMWEYNVLVTGIQKDDKIQLEDIEKTED